MVDFHLSRLQTWISQETILDMQDKQVSRHVLLCVTAIVTAELPIGEATTAGPKPKEDKMVEKIHLVQDTSMKRFSRKTVQQQTTTVKLSYLNINLSGVRTISSLETRLPMESVSQIT
jgi:hypothetical protein